ncbi:hypothetical protein CCMSSC00406_0003009 [Pleurotus cornucopiae]|uniref:Uncharacterized protein n=1 Tax=Pleurotus cornucopiae TaxID=5321 RepID=A0ACB7J5Z3_PLECO|nr:hypothetical protein CCMSSC00406_0003009 [Pleurotus cornucopiae]
MFGFAVANNLIVALGATTIASYLLVVHRLRWRRYDDIHAKYETKFKEGKLTPRDAQEIMHASAFYDMPTLMTYSLSFALFKTYAIPSISKILAGTREFTDPSTVSRRYADTEILICTWIASQLPGKFDGEKEEHVSDPRGMIALARTNWLHSKYSIKNEDYIYTLALFILEPISWARRYGWRPLSPMEQQSYFLFWVEISKRMEIRDVPGSLDELEEWTQAYEQQAMLPAQSNSDVAVGTTNELLHAAPEAFGIKDFLRRITVCLLDERVRIAMMYPSQPWYLHALTRTLLTSVKYFQKYLCLPRSSMDCLVRLETPPGDRPRLNPTRYRAVPWYRQKRTGILSLLDNFLVGVGFHDDLPGPKYHADGYRIEELGPPKFEQIGREEVMQMAERLHGCPIKGPWSLQPEH